MPETDSLNYIREHIALGTGWTFIESYGAKYWTDPAGNYRGGGTRDPLPNFISSLEDIQVAVLSLSLEQFIVWKAELCSICAVLGHDPIIASVHSRALALYKILP